MNEDLLGQRLYAANYYIDLARKSMQLGDDSQTREAYFRAVEAWKQAAKLDPTHKNSHEAAQEEYANFVKQDSLYLEVLPKIKKIIAQKVGILQTQLYIELQDISKENLSYVLYFADVHGEIKRTKQGRTYSLSLPITNW